MKIKGKFNKICILGGGLWGTALANHLARQGIPVWLWEFYPELARKLQKTRRHPHIAGLRLKPSVRVTSDIETAAGSADLLLVVLPSSFLRATARKIRPLLKSNVARPVIVNASKGVEPSSLQTMGQILEEELPFSAGRLFTLSGPSFAREVARGVPTKMVLAGPAGALRARVIGLLEGDSLRIEPSADRLGVELGGSLKNVLAIGCGILDGLNAGANTKAALMTQGAAEMGALIKRLGGRRETMYGLSGIGDLIATGTSPESRNRTLGEKLGKGEKLSAALRKIPTVAEGVQSAHSALALSKACGLKTPLLGAIWRVLHRNARPRELVAALGFSV